MRHHLPPSARELRVAGNYLMYAQLDEFDGPTLALDIHVCEPALREVATQSLAGFRFVDPAMRAGVRLGAVCACRRGDELACCARVPDVHGELHAPEVWHASSFDWHFPGGAPLTPQDGSAGAPPGPRVTCRTPALGASEASALTAPAAAETRMRVVGAGFDFGSYVFADLEEQFAAIHGGG